LVWCKADLWETAPTSQGNRAEPPNAAVLAAEGNANVTFAMQSLDQAAPELGVTLTRFGLRPDDDLAAKFRQMEQSDPEGLIVIAGALTYVKGKEIAELALAHRLPSCHAF
jgi:putative ABC transport system substrate-binding protein